MTKRLYPVPKKAGDLTNFYEDFAVCDKAAAGKSIPHGVVLCFARP